MWWCKVGSSGFVLTGSFCFLQLVESEEQFQQSLADVLVEETSVTVNVWVKLASSCKLLKSAICQGKVAAAHKWKPSLPSSQRNKICFLPSVAFMFKQYDCKRLFSNKIFFIINNKQVVMYLGKGLLYYSDCNVMLTLWLNNCEILTGELVRDAALLFCSCSKLLSYAMTLMCEDHLRWVRVPWLSSLFVLNRRLAKSLPLPMENDESRPRIDLVVFIINLTSELR